MSTLAFIFFSSYSHYVSLISSIWLFYILHTQRSTIVFHTQLSVYPSVHPTVHSFIHLSIHIRTYVNDYKQEQQSNPILTFFHPLPRSPFRMNEFDPKSFSHFSFTPYYGIEVFSFLSGRYSYKWPSSSSPLSSPLSSSL